MFNKKLFLSSTSGLCSTGLWMPMQLLKLPICLYSIHQLFKYFLAGVGAFGRGGELKNRVNVAKKLTLMCI